LIAGGSLSSTRINSIKSRNQLQQQNSLFSFTTFQDGNHNNRDDDGDDSLSFAELLQKQE